MNRLSSFIRADKEFRAAEQIIAEGLVGKNTLPLAVSGLSSGALHAFLAESIQDATALSGGPALVFAGDGDSVLRLTSELSAAGLSARAFPSRDLVYYAITASHDRDRERLSVLSALLSDNPPDVIVTTPSAALLSTVPPDVLHSLCLSVKRDETLSQEKLTAALDTLGFARVDMVESAGQYAKRGDVVDVFAEAEELPIRFEFFGDEIDRCVTFDPITQRVSENADGLDLTPAVEVLLNADAKKRILSCVKSLLAKNPAPEEKKRLEGERATLEAGLPVSFADRFIGAVYPSAATLLDYFSRFGKTPVYFVGSDAVREEMKNKLTSLNAKKDELIRVGLTTAPAAKFSGSEADFNAFCEQNFAIHVNTFSGGVGTVKLSGLIGFRTRRTSPYGDNAVLLFDDLAGYRKENYKTVIASPTLAAAKGLLSALCDAEIPATLMPDDFKIEEIAPGQIVITVATLTEGYDLILPRVAILSLYRDESRDVMRTRRRERLLKKHGAGERLMSYADLSVGDYVVHANFGIGLFEGIQTLKTDGVAKDYITIRYAGTDKLLVPCDRLEYIGKYIGARDKDGEVKLSKMGGGDWNRTKTRAKSAVKDIARDLIRLYAERQRRPGFAFPADSEMEREFDEAFAYDKTASQVQAIEEIKRDMMKPVPMNRLLCGDVGFGKTEVALEAAFKAIMGGKQVAILVPTTILAMQHYETALSRMRGYPVRVDMLTRFSTAKTRAAILRRVERGETDVLIGTHRLLSGELKFRDLGLLVIDEEQRFGVAQKEKLKQAAGNVDVLTLTATPIPRTLNMAMNGISDISILDEAPGDRHPVQTYVLEYDEAVLRDAVARELDRAGQVLYLCNNISKIDLIAGRIAADFPTARVAYAHGQMEKDELEDVWQTMVRGEIDVLVCTTIVETGIDLPAANTLIIENADRMGLSQLHQIRGRVGRSARHAYAYFTYKPDKILTEVAEKRLSAIREFAEFGAGFKIALRDLEIRGAGNLLGAEQHGYIDGVGYDLYVKLLSEAVLEEEGKTPEAPFESTVDYGEDANIPESYIASSAGRMEIYKKISLIRTKEDMEDVADECYDRFGEMPRATDRLLKVSLIRALASSAKISRTTVGAGAVKFILTTPDLPSWSELFVKHAGLSMRGADLPTVTFRLSPKENPLDAALTVLEELYDVQKKNRENADTKGAVNA